MIDFYKINPQDIIVVADDLDIEIGNYKISKNKRSAGHNGIQNIIDNLKTQDFIRIRIGVETQGGRKARGQISGHKFVLQNFTQEEQNILQNIFEKVCKNFLQKN